MDFLFTNGSWQVVTTSNDFLFHYFILSISLSLVLSYSSNGTQFISLSSIIDKVQRKDRKIASPIRSSCFAPQLQRSKSTSRERFVRTRPKGRGVKWLKSSFRFVDARLVRRGRPAQYVKGGVKPCEFWMNFLVEFELNKNTEITINNFPYNTEGNAIWC